MFLNRNSKYFTNKRVVITGGGGGLGQALVARLKTHCEHIYLVDIQFSAPPTTDNISHIHCDVTSLHEVEEELGSLPEIDIVINNAGVTHLSKALDTDFTVFEKVLNVNLMASIYVTQTLLPRLIRRRGHLVGVSSVAGYTPLFGRSAYSASKHALEAYCLSVYAEYKAQGLDLTVIRPAYIATQPNKTANLNAGITSPGANKKQSSSTSLTAEAAANKIVAAIAEKTLFCEVGMLARTAKWIFRLFPSFYIKKMVARTKADFED